MNEVKLSGYFKNVTAYTDQTLRVSDITIWQTLLGKDYTETTFYSEDDNSKCWIKVRMDSVMYDYIMDNELSDKYVIIKGALCTEVSRGTGIVSNYIQLKTIEKLLTK